MKYILSFIIIFITFVYYYYIIWTSPLNKDKLTIYMYNTTILKITFNDHLYLFTPFKKKKKKKGPNWPISLFTYSLNRFIRHIIDHVGIENRTIVSNRIIYCITVSLKTIK